MEQARTLLLLFGGRPQPNAMLAAMLKPQQVVAIVSQDVRYNVRDVLAGVVSGPVVVEKVPPYDIRRVQQVIEHHWDEGVTAIGVTGAPLPMAVAAYEVGRQRDIPVYYVNTGQGEILDLVHLERKPLRIKISLPDLFAVYRLTLDPSSPPPFATTPAQRAKAARLLGQNTPKAAELLVWMRENGDGETLTLNKRWPYWFTESHWNLLRRL